MRPTKLRLRQAETTQNQFWLNQIKMKLNRHFQFLPKTKPNQLSLQLQTIKIKQHQHLLSLCRMRPIQLFLSQQITIQSLHLQFNRTLKMKQNKLRRRVSQSNSKMQPPPHKLSLQRTTAQILCMLKHQNHCRSRPGQILRCIPRSKLKHPSHCLSRHGQTHHSMPRSMQHPALLTSIETIVSLKLKVYPFLYLQMLYQPSRTTRNLSQRSQRIRNLNPRKLRYQLQ